ncbi:MAG: DUF4386 domain-containing protein [Rhodothermales bacterium]
MQQFQKIGGIAALIEAGTFIIGFWVYVTMLGPAGYTSTLIDTTRKVSFLVENKTFMYVWYLIIYVLFGIMLVVLALSLDERLKENTPILARLSTAFGLIWAGLVIASGMVANIGTAAVVNLYGIDQAQAVALWHVLDFVVNGLGGGNEIVGGLWIVLISKAASCKQSLPGPLNILGYIIGIAGMLTTIPLLAMLGAVFGLGLIVWFIWIGVVLLRTH